MNDSNFKSSAWRFLGELRRRRVIRVAIVYAAAGWLTIEVATTVLPPLDAPLWSVKAVIILVALGLPIAIVIAWIFDLGPHGLHRTDAAADPASAHVRDLTPDPPARRRAQEEDGRRSIAVLPFVNMSGDAQNEYFSDGISEEILNLLAKLPQLRVSSRHASKARISIFRRLLPS